MPKMPSKRRLLNIIKRMLDNGEVFYTTFTPRMSMNEYYHLTKMGFRIQCDQTIHEGTIFHQMNTTYNTQLLERLSNEETQVS